MASNTRSQTDSSEAAIMRRRGPAAVDGSKGDKAYGKFVLCWVQYLQLLGCRWSTPAERKLVFILVCLPPSLSDLTMSHVVAAISFTLRRMSLFHIETKSACVWWWEIIGPQQLCDNVILARFSRPVCNGRGQKGSAGHARE
jgi:hypothetical protein